MNCVDSPCAPIESLTGVSEPLVDSRQDSDTSGSPTEQPGTSSPFDTGSLRATRTRSTTARIPMPATSATVRRSMRNMSTTSSSVPRRQLRQPPGTTSLLGSPVTVTRKRPTPAASLKSPPSSRKKQRLGELKNPPANLKDDADYEDSKPKAKEDDGSDCCICMTCPEPHQRSTVDGCDHQYCFDCIAQWSDRENSCPLCKVRFTKITRCHPVAKAGRGEKKAPATKTVKNRDQHADMVFGGRALEGLLASIAARGGGVRAFQAGHGFAGRIVFGSNVGGFGSMFAIGEGRRMFNGFDSDEEDDESEFLFGGFGDFSARTASVRHDGEASAGMGAAARARAGQSMRPLHPTVHTRSSRTRSVPSFAAARAAAAARSSDTRGAHMSIPSLINVQRSISSAPGNRDEIGATATRPLEIVDDSDDDVVEVVGVTRPT